jgi:hypothetical protein
MNTDKILDCDELASTPCVPYHNRVHELGERMSVIAPACDIVEQFLVLDAAVPARVRWVDGLASAVDAGLLA